MTHEKALLEDQVEGSNAARVEADIEALKKTIAELEEAVAAAKTKQAEAKAECSKLEKDMAEFKDNKDGKIKELKVGDPLFLKYKHWSHFFLSPK